MQQPYRRDLNITFDGSLEGFLCIVHAYYYDKILPIRIQSDTQPEQQALDAETFYVGTDFQLASKVQKAIGKKISRQAQSNIALAFMASDEERYQDLFRYILLGFKLGEIVDNHLQEDCVLNVQKRASRVGKEAHLLYGFCRFAEIKNGLFYSTVTPENDVLPLLAEYFSDRMMYQAWIIHDKKRNLAAIYNGNHYTIEQVPNNIQLQYSFGAIEESKEMYEKHVQDLWTTFFNAIAIPERTNPKLQRNLLPLHFRKNMLEFQQSSININEN